MKLFSLSLQVLSNPWQEFCHFSVNSGYTRSTRFSAKADQSNLVGHIIFVNHQWSTRIPVTTVFSSYSASTYLYFWIKYPDNFCCHRIIFTFFVSNWKAQLLKVVDIDIVIQNILECFLRFFSNSSTPTCSYSISIILCLLIQVCIPG